ncbi:uncharacterized protein PGTG_09860 [Puccinia graminis f. sp. tritici CRL 75-36-700-3]|uniref:Uncharacterized protein n=1 Tax=Puccinia graminis f. sp. tritici (strain CRL 75-36-700-3 / race SCCL) TaxID=418459 RepID=E3KF65_PUCGT|nr:uncharacterized protein PGTG_09860 [Puccinia graminis f. sp. tritici CRL 75-36-700-3]EFP82892.2 hypothetical protein PGTG_09860 [Puccinia graminis f. sp. tritici CRL 75-36-700-3]
MTLDGHKHQKPNDRTSLPSHRPDVGWPADCALLPTREHRARKPARAPRGRKC